MFRAIISCILGLTLLGCASGRPTNFESKDESPIDFVERMSLDLSKKLSYPDISASKKSAKSRAFDELYVEFTPFIVGSAGVMESLEGYCSGLEGTFRNGACVKGNDFFFYSVVKKTRRSTRDGNELAVTVVSSNSSSENHLFHKRVKQLGYLTEAEMKEKQDSAARQWQTQVELMRLKSEQNKQQVLASAIGTKVCKWYQDVLYVGYIEAKSEENIKILVADAAYKGDPSIKLGGFSQKMLWDSAQNWEVCG